MSFEHVVDQRLLNAKTAAQEVAVFAPDANATPQDGYYHHISWATGVTSGVVKIESASSSTYAGTWSVLATVTFAGTAPNEDSVFTPGRPKAIRHRISTIVAGGATPSVTTYIEGVV